MEATLFSTFLDVHNWLFSNDDRCFRIHEVKQLNHIRVAHANATVARRPADFVFVLGPVDVNEAVARIGVVFVQTVEPKNARHHQVLRRRQRITWRKRHAAAKDRAAGGIAADFFYDAKSAGRRLETALFSPDTKVGSGNRVGTQRFIASFQSEALLSNGDVDLSGCTFHNARAGLQSACR
jgi:hypothetical protein